MEALKQLKTFPNHFKEPVLKCVHKAKGNMKEVTDKCMKFLTTHYCLQEDVVIVNTKSRKKSPGVIIEVLKNVDVDADEKENGGVNPAGTQVSRWKYSVQLTGSDVVLKDLLPDEIKRKTKLPSKGLLKMFIKHKAERLPVDGKDIWLLKVNNL
ncbi:Hypothetical predicted protein [Paramuricea clavata]|nr:Hypothetical predicted protein [Paramuricea clavata]